MGSPLPHPTREGRYRTAAGVPVRSTIERHEIPDREAHWLPGFLAGGWSSDR